EHDGDENRLEPFPRPAPGATLRLTFLVLSLRPASCRPLFATLHYGSPAFRLVRRVPGGVRSCPDPVPADVHRLRVFPARRVPLRPAVRRPERRGNFTLGAR